MCEIKSLICHKCGNNTGEAISVHCNMVNKGRCRKVHTGTLTTNICEACNMRKVYTMSQNINNLSQQMSNERAVYRRNGRRVDELASMRDRERLSDEDKHDYRRYGVESMLANAAVAAIPANFGDNGHGLYGDHQPKADPYWLAPEDNDKPKKKPSTKQTSRRLTRPFEPLPPISPVSSLDSISTMMRAVSPLSPSPPPPPPKPAKPRPQRRTPAPALYVPTAADITVYPVANRQPGDRRALYVPENSEDVARQRAARHGRRYEGEADRQSFVERDESAGQFQRRDPRPGDNFRGRRPVPDEDKSDKKAKPAPRARRASDAGASYAGYATRYTQAKVPKSAGGKSLGEISTRTAKATRKFFKGIFGL